MEDDQQFCLRWNNHQSTLISVFDTLLENETLVDCTLAAEGKFLKAHKVVLSACSPYFATLLQEQYDKHPIFILKDVKYQELRAMMDYMYRGEVNISQDQLAALLKAAESLQIKGLSDNRSGSGGNASKPEQQQQQMHHQRGGMNVVPPVVVPGSGLGGAGKLSSGYTLEQTKRARVGPTSMESHELLTGSREGSSSPSRRRRKVRRRSIENVMIEAHDNSNSSQLQAANQQSSSSILLQQQQQQQQSNASLVGVGAITAAASALAAATQGTGGIMPTTASSSSATSSTGGNASAQLQQAGSQSATAGGATKKTDSVKGSDAMNTDNVQTGSSGTVAVGDDHQQQQHLQQAELLEHIGSKSEKANHKQKSVAAKDGGGIVASASSELVIEPKSEYDDDGNDETVEDLTLDDEDMGMDDLDHNAGTSQGAEGSSQGYAAWQHDRSQDELLLATQEAQQRDPQELHTSEMKSRRSRTGSKSARSKKRDSIVAAKRGSRSVLVLGLPPGSGRGSQHSTRARSTAAALNTSSVNASRGATTTTATTMATTDYMANSSRPATASNATIMIDCKGPPYNCRNCGRVYQHPYTLKRHMTSECNQPKKFLCLICGRAFHHNFKLAEHYLRLHGVVN